MRQAPAQPLRVLVIVLVAIIIAVAWGWLSAAIAITAGALIWIIGRWNP